MSKFETKPNSGSLFKNEHKEQDNHADFQGSALIDGVEYWMSAWRKTADTGRVWMSFSFKPKQAPAPVRQAAASPGRRSSQMDDDGPPF